MRILSPDCGRPRSRRIRILHYYLEHVFPDDFYGELLRHLPGITSYQNLFEVTTLKLDHFRCRDQRDLMDGWTEQLPAELRDFWNRFNEWFFGPDLAEAVLDSFAEPLRARIGDKGSWPQVSVESQLIRHRAGVLLGPHSDLHTKLVVLLLYLAPDDKRFASGDLALPSQGSRFSGARTASTIRSRTSSK